MWPAEIESLLDTEWAGRNVLYFSETDSTNTRAKCLGEEGAVHGTLIVAERQTEGKGRRGRRWESPSGSSIYMSILLRPDVLPNQAPMLTLVMAQSVTEAVRRTTGQEALIKWPNDIVIDGRKVCGMLTEMSVEREFIHYVVIGVGINVRAQEFAPEIASMAACLQEVCGKRVSRAELAACIMEEFEKYYDIFLETEELTGLLERYNELLINRDRQVRVLDPAGEFQGISRGIDSRGELLVEREDGSVERVYAGEVSVRGIYGYT